MEHTGTNLRLTKAPGTLFLCLVLLSTFFFQPLHQAPSTSTPGIAPSSPPPSVTSSTDAPIGAVNENQTTDQGGLPSDKPVNALRSSPPMPANTQAPLKRPIEALAESAASWPLSYTKLATGEWWRLFSYPLAGRNGALALLGCVAIYTLGRSLEPIMGTAQLFCILLTGTVTGALAQYTAAKFGFCSATNIEGHAPLLFGMLGAYGTLIPDWPVGASSSWGCQHLKAQHVYWGALAGALALWFSGWLPETGPVSMVTAIGTSRIMTQWMGFGGLRPTKRLRRESEEDSDYFYNEDSGTQQALTWKEFVSSEIDPLLEKIARNGIQSLTQTELLKLRTTPPVIRKPPTNEDLPGSG